jgi:hypothetical protein
VEVQFQAFLISPLMEINVKVKLSRYVMQALRGEKE